MRCALLAAMLACAPGLAQAWEIQGLSGDTWGRVGQDLTGKTGLGVSTYVNQGIDWVKLPGDIMFNTYAEYRYSKRTKENTYFDASGPALGAMLVRPPFRLGTEYFWPHPVPPGSPQGGSSRAYLSWYTEWHNLQAPAGRKAGGFRILGLTGSSWGRISDDLNGPTGTSISSYINQGVDWCKLPGDITLNTYAEVRLGFRDKDKFYANAWGPALGVELQRWPLRLGMDYYWERFTEQHQTDDSWRLYLSWYYNWDLKGPLKGLLAH